MAVAGRGSASPHHRSRAQQAMQEFLRFPLCVLGGWLACAGVVIAFDRGLLGATQPVSGVLAEVVPRGTTSTLLQSIIAGLITMISIIFFVLIMAVQHQSSSYSPVVFDQFLRRRSNQAFFGVLIGETAYCILVETLIPPKHTVLAGTVALAGIVLTLGMLLTFIYSTVDQMRPSAIVWMIQHLALRARERQQPLLSRCREESQLSGVAALPVSSANGGYLVHIDGHRLEQALGALPAKAEVEIEFEVTMGDHLVPGALLAQVRGSDRDTRDRLATAVLAAVTLGRMPVVDRDAGHAVDHLGNISWSAAAGNDPEGARVAIHAMHGLLAHWGHQAATDPEDFGGKLPIVYQERIVPKLLDSLTSVVVATTTSGQHQSCSYALRGLAEVLPRLAPEDQNAAVDRLQRVLPCATQQLYTREMEEAFTAIYSALNTVGMDADRDRVGELRQDLEQRHRLATPEGTGRTEYSPQPSNNGDGRSALS